MRIRETEGRWQREGIIWPEDRRGNPLLRKFVLSAAIPFIFNEEGSA
jgi:hypothetical protein